MLRSVYGVSISLGDAAEGVESSGRGSNTSAHPGGGIHESPIEQSDSSMQAVVRSANTLSDDEHEDLTAEPLISRGRNARGRYPYYVSLRSKGSDFHLCGGALIAPDTLMTAALHPEQS